MSDDPYENEPDPGADLDQEEAGQQAPIIYAPQQQLPQQQQPPRPVAPAQVRPATPTQAAAAGAPREFFADFGGGAAVGKKQGMLRDLADQFMASAAETGSDIVSFASLAARNLSADPEVVKWLEGQRRWLGQQAESWIASMSPEGQLAAHSALFGGGEDAQGNHIPSPGEVGWVRYAAHAVTSAIPAPVIAITGGLVAAGAIAALPEELAVGTAAAGAIGTATTAGLFGAIQSGGWYRSFVDTIDKAKPEQLMTSPVYADARSKGADDLTARRMVVEKMMPFAAAQFAVGAAAGGAVQQLIRRGAVGAGTSLGSRVGVGAAEGATAMGGQGGAGDYLAQQASIQAGTQNQYDPTQTAKAFASGALGGAILGAAGGALHRIPRPGETPEMPARNEPQAEALALPGPRRELPPPQRPATDGISYEQQAALSIALPKPDVTYGAGRPWESTGSGMMPGTPGFTMRPSDGVVPRPPVEVPPRPTPAGPALPAPQERAALSAPNAVVRGAQGEGFVVQPGSMSPEPARPSGGMNRGNLIEQLSSMGQDPKVLRRMSIGDLRDTYDRLNTPAEPTRQEFRPTGPQIGAAPTPTPVAVEPTPGAAAPVAARPVAVPETAPAAKQTVGDQLKARRAEQKQRMAEPIAALVKRDQVKPRAAEVEIRPDEDENEVAAEVENQPQVFEPEHGKATTVVSEGGPAQERSPLTTNKDRILSDLENKIINEGMSPVDADKAYGRKEGGRGRARTYPDLASWLKSRIETLSDPVHQERIVEQARRLQEDKTLSKPKRDAAARALNEAISHTDPNYIEKLRSALDEIESPEKKAAAAQTKSAALARIRERLQAKRESHDTPGSYAIPESMKLMYDERVNRPARQILDESHKAGVGVSVHRYLDAIASDPIARVRVPHLAALARRLKEMLPENLEVMSQETAAKRFGSNRFIRLRSAGTYWPARDGRPDLITLQSNEAVRYPRTTMTSLLHEGLHAVTTRYIEQLRSSDADVHILFNIHNELANQVDRYGAEHGLSEPELKTLHYALSDFYEMHTMLMTDPVVQRFAASIKPSAELLSSLRELGVTGPVRSLWNAFTGFVRRALGLPASTSSLLDHVMRPLQGITDRADAFNRAHPELRNLPDELRQPAEDLLDASHNMPNFVRDDVMDEVMRHVPDAGNTSRVGRRALLTGATTDGIVNWNRDLFKSRDPEAPGNSLEDWRTASENIAAASKKVHDTYDERVSKLLAGFKTADRDKVASLLNDATIAEVHLGTTRADANAHLTRPEQQATLRQLQARYNALSDAGKRLYGDAVALERQMHAQEREAQLASMIKTAIPDATKPQIEALAQAAKTKRGQRALIDNPDASDVARAFADAWHRNRTLVRGIAQVHSRGFVQGDYFPLRRYGDWVIRYGTKGTDDYGVEMFERYAEAAARREELVREGVEPSQVLDKREYATHLHDLLPTTVMNELNAAVSRALGPDHAEAVNNLLASIMLQHATRSEAARSRLRRQGVKGASTEVEKTIARDYLAFASRMGYLEHGPDRTQALSAMRRHVDWLGRNGEAGEQPRASAVLKEIEQRMPSGDDASDRLTGLARKFSQMGYVYSLMSPSHMLTSTIEAHMNSTALLGARHGFGSASLALTKALRDTTPVMTATGTRNVLKSLGAGMKAADWNLSHVVRDKMIANGANRQAMVDLFNRLNNAGLIDHSFVRELQRIARPTGDITKGWWGRFMDLNGAMAHAVDVANKAAIAKAAYDLELRKTGSHDRAARFAVEMARQSMPNYNLVNKARISTNRGPLGGMAAPLTQFKQYGIHMYSMMSVLAKNAMHGATRDERMEARKAFAAIIATHALMAGSLTLIADPLRYIMGAYDFITGAARPHDYQNDVRAWIADAFGPELGELIARGLPHALGIDIHRRVGLANLLEIPELKSFDKKGYEEVLIAAMTGAAGQDAVQMAAGLHKMLPWGGGDIVGGLKDLVPRVVRDPLKAVSLAEKGVTDSRGKTVLPASRLSTADIAAQAIGFQPSRVSEFREGRNAILERREELRDDRAKVMQAFVQAAPSERKDVLSQVQQYNRAHPHEPITYSQLTQALKRQQQSVANPATYGLQLPKKSAHELSKYGAFANPR